MNSCVTQWPDVRPETLWWAQHRPGGVSSHLFRGTQLTEKRRLFLVERCLQRHERHEAARLRVVERREAVLIRGVHVDAGGCELLDDCLVAFADCVVQRGAAADFLDVVDEGRDVDVCSCRMEDADHLQRLLFGRAARQYRHERGLAVGRLQVDVGAVLETGMAALYAAVDMNTLPWMHNRPPSAPSGRLEAVDLIKVLLAHNADPNGRLKGPILQKHHDAGDRNLGEGSTPLMRAAKAADATTMRLLLAAGADATLVQRNGTSALMIAAGLGRGNAGSYGRVSGSAQEAIEAVSILIDAGLKVESANTEGQTALHGVAGRADDVAALIQFLVDRGADPLAKNKRGQTALDLARAGAQVGTLRVLNQENVAILTQLTPMAPRGAQ